MQTHHDSTALKALTHPLRLQILAVLREEERATATTLAARFAETSGATSYHLRQLARHGLIEDLPAEGRERWWRLAPAVGTVILDHLDDLASSSPELFAERTRLRLSPDQARTLGAEIAELIDRYRLLSAGDAGDRVELTYRLRLSPAHE